MGSWLRILLGTLLLASCSPAALFPTPASPPPLAATQNNPPAQGLPGYLSTSLEIIRNGKSYHVLLGYDIGEAFFRATPRLEIPQWYDDAPEALSANLEWYGDVDKDGETEYLVTLFGRGAACDMSVIAIDYDSSADEYRLFDRLDGYCTSFDGWKDIEEDGIPELIGKDQEFHLAVGGGGMDNVFAPIKIYRYDGQKFVGVTDQYPALVKKDAELWVDGIKTQAWGQGSNSTILAAYLADMYELGKQSQGEQEYLQLCRQYLAPEIENLDCNALLEQVTTVLAQKGD